MGLLLPEFLQLGPGIAFHIVAVGRIVVMLRRAEGHHGATAGGASPPENNLRTGFGAETRLARQVITDPGEFECVCLGLVPQGGEPLNPGRC